MITYKYGDVTEATESPAVLCHVVNNVGAFGAGVAKSIADKYPQAKQDYLHAWRQFQLGEVLWYMVNPNLTIANMFAQNGLVGPYNPHPLSYIALSSCMNKVKSQMNDDEVIVAPQFGAGLAGGDWEIIEPMINQIWSDKQVVIYKYL